MRKRCEYRGGAIVKGAKVGCQNPARVEITMKGHGSMLVCGFHAGPARRAGARARKLSPAEQQATPIGEQLVGRPLVRDRIGFVPGQHDVVIDDPEPNRHYCDMGAIVTFVTEERLAVRMLCVRLREDQEWHCPGLQFARLRDTKATTHGAITMRDIEIEALEQAAYDAEPYPFDPIPPEEKPGIEQVTEELLGEVFEYLLGGKEAA